ncbi:hypothetical protein [Sphingobacterium rhinopitheci]|uniref:hypothetical protein n=1 Tax=Sphingobacterium rhinopitheci TaxID=2781960 RepID=UPI001F5299D0|nr:hypothetical protein [Sphingobacterium rhinopitheci]MCI0922722.1 hypothetical protein [Sphingobacterium rhinopitheci]
MKKILSLAVLLSGISFTTLAQESPKPTTTKEIKEGYHNGNRGKGKQDMSKKNPEEIAKYRTENLDKQVKLSDKQREQVYALYLNNAKTKKEQINSGNKDQNSREEAKKASREQLNKILTTEQQKLMSDKQDKGSNKGKGNKEQNQGGKKTDNKGKNKKSVSNNSK